MNHAFEWLDLHPIFWPLFIILARISDVSIGTVRTIAVVRGYRLFAAILGFCEVTIWLLIVSGILEDITLLKIISYGVGFALGNYVGIHLEQQLAMGIQLIFLISRGKAHAVAFGLRMADYLVTELPAYGRKGEVALCFTVVPRRQAPEVLRIARTVDENVNVIVEDVRQMSLVTRPATAVPVTGWRSIIKKK
ncbi:MAG: hypothetical protein HJJLKODD_02488 [Phycisphaerae bacterium]|nr:hypothetical protein [Phycisphaerae bacterium]